MIEFFASINKKSLFDSRLPTKNCPLPTAHCLVLHQDLTDGRDVVRFQLKDVRTVRETAGIDLRLC